MMAQNLIHLPDSQNFDCHSCARCCHEYAVPVTEEERRRIEQQGWDRDEATRGRPLFERRPGRGRQGFVLAPLGPGPCVFLDEANRCRLHARFGAQAKPLACRLYPFVLTQAGEQVRVALRFDCPAVAGNRGRSLSAHRRDLQQLAQAVFGEKIERPPPLEPGRELSWPKLVHLAEAFEHLLAGDSPDLTRRLVACVRLADLLQGTFLENLEDEGLEDFLRMHTEALRKAAPAEPLTRRPPGRMVARLFRQVIGLYSRHHVADFQGSGVERFSRLARWLGQSLRLVRGRGLVPPMQPDFPAVSFAAIEAFQGPPTGAAAALLARFYRVKFSGLAFFGRTCYHYSFLEGVSALLLTYPVMMWYARLYSLGQGASSLTDEAVERAVRGVDYQFGLSPLFGTFFERQRIRFLSQPQPLRELIVWYGS